MRTAAQAGRIPHRTDAEACPATSATLRTACCVGLGFLGLRLDPVSDEELILARWAYRRLARMID